MTNGTRLFNAVLLIVLIAICIYIGRTCNCNGVRPTRSDTISVKRDTVWLPQDTFISYVPQPYKVEHTKYEKVYLPGEPVPVYPEYDSLPESIKNLIADHYAKRYYADSFAIEYGKLYLYDTVRANKITGKSFRVKQDIPLVKETITLRERKNIVFIGATTMGNQQDLLFGAGFNLTLKTKSDRLFQVGALLTKTGTPMYQGSFSIPIRLKGGR